MAPVKWIAQHIPERVQPLIRDSYFGHLYYKHDFYNNRTEITLPSPIGEIDLYIDGLDRIIKNKAQSQYGYEPGLIQLMEKELTGESVFYDIGSRFGFYGVVATELGVKPNNIFLFESHPKFIKYLDKNTNNCNIVTDHVGVKEDNLSIDEFIIHNKTPSVIKIDVEGAERDVLDCMGEALNDRPALFIEYHPNQSERDGILNILDKYGYDHDYINHRKNKDGICYLDAPLSDSTSLIYASSE